MRWSQLFIPTLRDTPSEAEVPSHQLLLRAGYIRQLAAGIYNYLFLAKRSLLKIERIIREEMDAIGAQEFQLPELHPAEIWQESGRWEKMGHDMFRLKDRWGRDLCLGMTEEEVMTSIARGELRSYKQLPQLWYQIQVKFRDEPRPKSGLMRVRRFTMKDSYSFDIDAEGLDISYEKHHSAYCRILGRSGLRYLPVEAHSGAMGGSKSHEFVVPSDAGEDLIVICDGCGYAANLEKAASITQPCAEDDPPENASTEEFATPGKKTISEVAEFDGRPETSHIKSLVMVADEKPVLVLLRGDHQLNEAKLSSLLGAAELRPAHPEEVVEWTGAASGSIGPVGIAKMEIIADRALEGRRNMVTGANKDDRGICRLHCWGDVAVLCSYHWGAGSFRGRQQHGQRLDVQFVPIWSRRPHRSSAFGDPGDAGARRSGRQHDHGSQRRGGERDGWFGRPGGVADPAHNSAHDVLRRVCGVAGVVVCLRVGSGRFLGNP